MLTATDTLATLKAYYGEDTRDFMRILVNGVSSTEANLALQVLRASVPEKALVSACNLREVLGEFPTSPFVMRVDEYTLARSQGLERGIASMCKRIDQDTQLCVTTAGNLVLDIIVKHAGQKHFVSPLSTCEDFVGPQVVDLFFTCDTLLQQTIDLITGMGIVFNPKFYLSLEDWHLEYAQDVFAGLEDIF